MWIYHPCLSHQVNCYICVLSVVQPPSSRGILHTCLWAGGFQWCCISFKISQKPFYSQWQRIMNKIKHLYTHHFEVRNCHPSVAKGWFSLWSDDSFRHFFASKWWLLIFYLAFLSFLVIYLNVKWFDQFFFKFSLSPVLIQNGSFISAK